VCGLSRGKWRDETLATLDRPRVVFHIKEEEKKNKEKKGWGGGTSGGESDYPGGRNFTGIGF
jgi:hypothetical protein